MTREELLTRLMDDLNKRYPIGLYEYLYEHCPELHNELLNLEDRIDQTSLNPSASIDQLKAVLREYWTFHMKAIKESTRIGKLDLSQAKKELLENKCVG
jgi:hypothetical protein